MPTQPPNRIADARVCRRSVDEARSARTELQIGSQCKCSPLGHAPRGWHKKPIVPTIREKTENGHKRIKRNNRPRCKRITTPPHKRVVVPNHGPENRMKRCPKKNNQTCTPQVYRHQPETIMNLPGVKTNCNQHRTDSARRTQLPSIQCKLPSPSPIPSSTGGLQ